MRQGRRRGPINVRQTRLCAIRMHSLRSRPSCPSCPSPYPNRPSRPSSSRPSCPCPSRLNFPDNAATQKREDLPAAKPSTEAGAIPFPPLPKPFPLAKLVTDPRPAHDAIQAWNPQLQTTRTASAASAGEPKRPCELYRTAENACTKNNWSVDAICVHVRQYSTIVKSEDTRHTAFKILRSIRMVESNILLREALSRIRWVWSKPWKPSAGQLYGKWEFPKIRGTLFGGLHNTDPTI